MAALLKELAPSIPAGIKVAGSNGKGSTCAIAARVLRAHGLRVGLFTSPHLFEVNERIQLDGAPISRADLAALDGRAMAAADRIAPGRFCAFELWTAAAAAWFCDLRADVVVWEAGLGGSLDPVRLVPAQVSVITNVSMEHTAVLGTSLPGIARDKAGIADPGSRLIAGPGVPGYARTAPSATVASISLARLALRGPHQRENAVCALSACEDVLGARFDPAAAEQALSQVRWPGRFERAADSPPVWVDVAHNPAALQRVVETVREQLSGRRIVLVIGVSCDRPHAEMAPIAAQCADVVICTSARHKGAPAELIAEACPEGSIIRDSVPEAMTHALALARREDAHVLVTGGLFLAAEALSWLREGS